MTTVRVSDFRAVKYCARGSRAWAKRRGLDWATFVREGLPAEQLLATGDDMAARVVEAAKKREQEEQQHAGHQ